jgi:Tat protein secretion system quality control protein TatD with DNase activity
LHLPEGWVVAVGVHPKHASDFGDYYFDRLSKLMDSPAVTALGEVGMDCSEGAKPFGIHKSTLRWVLALARPYMPLVLHIRASAPRQRIRCTGGIGLDAGESSQHPAEYPSTLLQWGFGYG